MSKYKNIKTIIDGIKFDSKKEAARYCELKLMLKSNLISNLELQPSFDICPKLKWNNKTLRKRVYKADFKYNQDGLEIVEDVKGMRTQTYLLKRSLFLHLYPQYIFREI